MPNQMQHLSSLFKFFTACMCSRLLFFVICFCCRNCHCWQLAVFEHGAHAFSRQLPSDKYLLPGPLCYVPKTDSFLTATAAGTVECYQYRALAEATADDVLDSRRSASAQGESATEVNDLLDSRGDSNSSAKTGSAGSSSSSDSEYLNGLMKGAKKSGSEREGKRLRAEWTAELGEQIFELKVS